MHWSSVASFLIGERSFDGAVKAVGFSKLFFNSFGVANFVVLACEIFSGP